MPQNVLNSEATNTVWNCSKQSSGQGQACRCALAPVTSVTVTPTNTISVTHDAGMPPARNILSILSLAGLRPAILSLGLHHQQRTHGTPLGGGKVRRTAGGAARAAHELGRRVQGAGAKAAGAGKSWRRAVCVNFYLRKKCVWGGGLQLCGLLTTRPTRMNGRRALRGAGPTRARAAARER